MGRYKRRIIGPLRCAWCYVSLGNSTGRTLKLKNEDIVDDYAMDEHHKAGFHVYVEGRKVGRPQ